jgi:hypothetical protein
VVVDPKFLASQVFLQNQVAAGGFEMRLELGGTAQDGDLAAALANLRLGGEGKSGGGGKLASKSLARGFVQGGGQHKVLRKAHWIEAGQDPAF